MSASYRVVITEPAERDLTEIADYIASELLEPFTARNMVAKIAGAIFELEQMPFRHALVRDERLKRNGVRVLPVDSYLIFYAVSEEDGMVTIIRILYGKRLWSSLL